MPEITENPESTYSDDDKKWLIKDSELVPSRTYEQRGELSHQLNVKETATRGPAEKLSFVQRLEGRNPALRDSTYVDESIQFKEIARSIVKSPVSKSLVKKGVPASAILETIGFFPPPTGVSDLYTKDAKDRAIFHESAIPYQNRLTQDNEEEANAFLTGHLTRWRNLYPRLAYPVEAFEAMANPAFKEWWLLGGGPSAIVDEVSGLPDVIWHGTVNIVDPKQGFTQQAGWDNTKYKTWFNWKNSIGEFATHSITGVHLAKSGKDISLESGPHFGTFFQALDITWKQSKKSGVLPNRTHVETEYIKGLANRATPVPETAKYYPGFIKMNNPLVIHEDLFVWDFNNIIGNLATRNILKKEGFTYSSISWGIDFDNKGIFYDGGSGSSLEKIYGYAVDAARKEGIELRHEYLDETLQELVSEKKDFAKLSNKENPKHKYLKYPYHKEVYSDPMLYMDPSSVIALQIEYYRMKGLMEFIQKDLGYDGIKYLNDIEDLQAPDWSFIIFDPRQFKSLYNDGSFDTDDHNFMSEIKSKKTNKYKVTA